MRFEKPKRPVAPKREKPAPKKKKPKKPKKTRPGGAKRDGRKAPPRNILLAVPYWALVIGLWVGGATLGLGLFVAYDLPVKEGFEGPGLLATQKSATVTLRDREGRELLTRGDLYGVPVTLDDVPDHLEQAVLATEDRRFYQHFGFDPIGFTRAMWANLRAGRIVQGGSTLTQQLAKNLFLTADKTLLRKGQELLLAFWLEYRFTKEEILTLYLNRVYLGSGTYGVAAASRVYFDKPVSALTVHESAMIAGLLKAPSRYAPTNSLRRSRERANVVIANMVAAGYLTETEAKAAKANPAGLAHGSNNQDMRWFTDWVLDRLNDYVLHADVDLVVDTTVDPDLQRRASTLVRSGVEANRKILQVDQGALIAMDHDGAVVALVGGRDARLSRFNRATQARRQPGSAFKPIVYVTAMEQGLTPDDRMRDSPIILGDWQPRNYKPGHRGEITLEEALTHSINTVAVKLSERVGRQQVLETAARFGITSDLPPHPSVALGTGGISLLEMTGAYIPFATGGSGFRVHGITRIATADGEVIYEKYGSNTNRVTSRIAAARMHRMLRSVIDEGTGTGAKLRGIEAGGKTGTSSDFRDAWFIGYTGAYVTGVWVGNDDGSPMKRLTGSGLPARLWRDFMTTAHKGVRPDRLPEEKALPVDDFFDDLFDSIFGGRGNR